MWLLQYWWFTKISLFITILIQNIFALSIIYLLFYIFAILIYNIYEFPKILSLNVKYQTHGKFIKFNLTYSNTYCFSERIIKYMFSKGQGGVTQAIRIPRILLCTIWREILGGKDYTMNLYDFLLCHTRSLKVLFIIFFTNFFFFLVL